jgi:hypothetical protein
MLASPVAAQQKIGVNGAVNPDATGTPPGGTSRRLVVGGDAIYHERIQTQAGGQTQILFLDESSLSVGPNSDVVIDEFIYNPQAGTGKMTLSVARGLLRFVGGRISKLGDAETLHTPTATVGIRGGIFLLNQAAQGPLDVVLVYGRLTVTGTNGVTRTITRPGYGVTVSGPGASPSPPAPAAHGAVSTLLAAVDGRAGGTGGASTIPTETTVANSGVATVISGNFPASVQAAAQNQPPAAQPRSFNVAAAQTNLQVGTVQNQASPVIQSAAANPTPPGTPIGSTGSQTPTSPPPTSPPPTGPVVITYAGTFKESPTANGFTNETAPYLIRYSAGTLTYPAGMPQSGVFSTALNQYSLSFPLLPGTNSFGPAGTSASGGGTFTGTSYLSPDDTFFYANLDSTTATNPLAFIFGGVPVDASFYAPTATNVVTAFTVEPDIGLGSGAQPQTIPFLPSAYGGTLANASVSPLYVVTEANQPFGAYNPVANPNVTSPRLLQGSLAVDGQGAGQSSALVVAMGSFDTSSATGTVIATGPVRGTVQASGAPLVHISSGFATVPDGNGNNLFGGSALSGFVLDQNEYDSSLNYVQTLANADPYVAGSGLGNVQYAFNQPVIAGAVPASVGVDRSALAETGYFGGIMQTGASSGTIRNFVVTGALGLQTDPVSSRLASTFGGGDPFTPRQSGVSSITLNFGSLPPGVGYSRSTFIDNNTYAAAESPVTADQINGTSLPTYTSANSSFSPSLVMVTSGTVPDTSLLPSGVSYCECQYLQWGYWTGRVQVPNAGDTADSANYLATINTWVAGQPTPMADISSLASTGAIGSYSGAAVGSVFNNGANYLAAGGFTHTYNFGTQTGTLAITNFDGRNFGGTVYGTSGSPSYSGALTGTALSGATLGTFYGPGAIETGGSFSVQSTAGPSYLASGIFAGRQIGR